MSRSKTVVIAKLAYARPSAADAEYVPVKPVLRSDIPGSATTFVFASTDHMRGAAGVPEIGTINVSFASNCARAPLLETVTVRRPEQEWREPVRDAKNTRSVAALRY